MCSQTLQLWPMAMHQPGAVDYVRRDGRATERELLSTARDLPLLLPLDLDALDGYSAADRRSQLVSSLWKCAQASVARASALRVLPVMHPIAAVAPTARRVQLLLEALLCALVALEIAPKDGCGTACWAAEALCTLYAGLSGVLLVDGALEAGAAVSALCHPSQWSSIAHVLPAQMVRQACLLAIAIAGLLVHPYVLLLSVFDLLPAIPRCRALLRPLAKAVPPVIVITALAAILAVPAVAAARAAGTVGECAAGDVAACAVQALALIMPVPPEPRARRLADDTATEPAVTASAPAADAAPSALLSQLGPLLLLCLGALVLQLGVAVLVDALADQRARALAAAEYAAEHCLVCGCPRSALDRLGARGFASHVARTHAPEAYARLLAESLMTPPAQRTDDDAWLLECASRSDPAFLPSASREYWDVHPGGVGGVGVAGGVGGVSTTSLGWRTAGWEPGSGAALGWQLSPEPSNAQLRAAIEQLAVDSARCWTEVRKGGGARRSGGGAMDGSVCAPCSHSCATPGQANGGGDGLAGLAGVQPLDWGMWVDRLAALERSCMLQAEHTGQATREASRVAAELQSRFGTTRETAAAVAQLAKMVQASSATVERVAAEVAAMRGGQAVTA